MNACHAQPKRPLAQSHKEGAVAVEETIVTGLLYRQGRLLLGKRSARRRAYPGVWDLPGGHVETGETTEQALVRELGEELGVTPTEWRELTVLRAPAMSPGTALENSNMLTLHVFLVTKWRGEPRNLQPVEHDTIAWITASEADGLTLAHADYPALFHSVLDAELDAGQ
jgi:8-oxo-dGTP diphosphatase